ATELLLCCVPPGTGRKPCAHDRIRWQSQPTRPPPGGAGGEEGALLAGPLLSAPRAGMLTPSPPYSPTEGLPMVPSRLQLVVSALLLGAVCLAQKPKERLYLDPIGLDVPHVSTDKSVKLDYPIVYVRAPRKNPDGRSRWAEVGDPRTMEPGSDLMLLHPDGKEEVLVGVGPQEAIADPYVSFDGHSVYYAKMHDALKHKGSDIYRVHVPTRKVTRLTHQEFTPNAAGTMPAWGVYNLGPCPLPGGRLAFVSDRNGFKASNPGYAPNALALQLFTMDDDGRDVECSG